MKQAKLTLLALGVVFGDIGTSPLYAVKETFSPDHGIAATHENILAGLSMMFWSLMIVVSLKYVMLIMRADNRGEGGIMALTALALKAVAAEPRWRGTLVVIGTFGAALFYGDAVLTPAISVLSAVEGLEVGTQAFTPYVVPIAVGVLVALFALQAQGTETVGRLFGPVTLLWFLAIGAAGLFGILREPAVLAALNPLHALRFLTTHAVESFVVLGAVVLAVTGAEALYADMGHFGKGAVRIGWFSLVAPALVLNYFGQGALLMAAPQAVTNPFYLLLPGWALYPMVALATAATVIASQAVISGAYSITRQATQLGFLPRMTTVHTSAREIGQVYLPGVNWLLCAAVLAAVIGFGSSSRLAGAYGVAVTGTMLVDTLLTFFVIRYAWRYPLWLCLLATGFFLVVDLAFFSATLLKIADGGWFPLAIGACAFAAMTIWRGGRGAPLCAAGSVLGAARAIPQEPVCRCAAARPGHRGVPHRQPRGHAARAAAQPQALPRRARARGVPDSGVPRRALGALRGARAGGAARAQLLARARALRVHEQPRRHARARIVRRARPGIRADGDVVLPFARKDRAGGVLARPPVRGDGAQRRQRDRLLQYSDQPRHRAWDARRDLNSGTEP